MRLPGAARGRDGLRRGLFWGVPHRGRWCRSVPEVGTQHGSAGTTVKSRARPLIPGISKLPPSRRPLGKVGTLPVTTNLPSPATTGAALPFPVLLRVSVSAAEAAPGLVTTEEGRVGHPNPRPNPPHPQQGSPPASWRAGLAHLAELVAPRLPRSPRDGARMQHGAAAAAAAAGRGGSGAPKRDGPSLTLQAADFPRRPMHRDRAVRSGSLS